jgi:hypothetical protein
MMIDGHCLVEYLRRVEEEKEEEDDDDRIIF